LNTRMHRLHKPLLLAVFFCALTTLSFAQTSTDAKPLLASAMIALNGTTTLNDVTMQGNTIRVIGPANDLGTVTLTGKPGQGRIDWQVGRGALSLILSGKSHEDPTGFWLDRKGTSHDLALHNCWVGQTWFSPALTLAWYLHQDFEVALLGPETREGRTVDHLQAWYAQAKGDPEYVDLAKQLSTIDIYLDQATKLPVSFTFSMHPEENASVNIPVEVRFSEYRPVNGVQAPFRVQRYQNGNLIYDTSVTSLLINTGVPDTRFTN
jgi:hypothetical protein